MITLLVGAASFASAGVPDLGMSSSASVNGNDVAVVFNLPNGDGAFFYEAISAAFAPIDATITLTLIDGLGAPVANFPFEDCWLINDDGGEFGGLHPCSGGATPDFNSDVNGVTTWANPLTAGGYTQGVTTVYISGAPLDAGNEMNISFNSADINGDETVDLIDVVKFTQDFYSGTDPFRSDFLYDGLVDLLDVVVLAQSQGASCP
jgi:hypothetical protein